MANRLSKNPQLYFFCGEADFISSLSFLCYLTPTKLNHTMTAVDTSVNFESTINEKDYPCADQVDVLADQEASIKLVNKLRALPEEWDEVVAYEYLSPSAREHSLTATTLRGENMIARRPIKFFNKDKTHCVMAVHFGLNL